MVLKGVDEINWFTDRPDRVEGTWKPQKLLNKWDDYFINSEPNAQAGFKANEEQEIVTFEMFKPKTKSGKMKFDIKPIGKSSGDKLTGLKGIELKDIFLSIDSATPGMPSCFPYCQFAQLMGLDFSGATLISDFQKANMYPDGSTPTNLSEATLSGVAMYGADLEGANMTGAMMVLTDLTKANLTGANLTDATLHNAKLENALYDSTTIWPTSGYWSNTTCPDGTNSDNNPSCGF